MSQQPDKFFRDKLSNYERPASADAWNRISQNLNRKNRWGLYLKIAATVLLLATGTLMIYPTLRGNNNGLVARENPGTNEPVVKHADSTISAVTDPKPSGAAEIDAIAKTTPPDKKERSKQPAAPVTKEKARALELSEDPDESVITTNIAGDPIETEPTIAHITPDQTETMADETPALREEKVTIVFTSDEVNKKYLAKNFKTEATTENEQPSGLKKLLDKASDLKNNQDLLGSLRQKKNEILAMNFRNEKETSQNQ